MPAADAAGNVTFYVAFGRPAFDATALKTVFPVRMSNITVSLGSVADAIGTRLGLTLTATSYSLMYLNAETSNPLIEARATTVSASAIPNGATVCLVPGA